MTEMLVIYLGAPRASILEKHNESLFFFPTSERCAHVKFRSSEHGIYVEISCSNLVLAFFLYNLLIFNK